MQVFGVRRAVLVDDHEIDVEQLEAPVLVGAQQLPDDVDVVELVDANDDDRQVAGDAVRPRARAPRVGCRRARSATAATTGRSRGSGWRGVGTGAPRRRRCRGGAAEPGHASRRGCRARSNVAGVRYLSARSSTCSRVSATTVAKTACTVSPGSMTTRRRRLKIGSSTAPDGVRQRAPVDHRRRRRGPNDRDRGTGPGRSRTG